MHILQCNNNNKIKSQEGLVTSQNVPKLGGSNMQNAAETTKD